MPLYTYGRPNQCFTALIVSLSYYLKLFISRFDHLFRTLLFNLLWLILHGMSVFRGFKDVHFGRFWLQSAKKDGYMPYYTHFDHIDHSAYEF